MLRSGVEHRLALVADADDLAPRLRACDRAEVEAASGPDVLGAMRAAVRATPDAQVFALRGKPVVIFGCVVPSLMGDQAVPWALASPEGTHVLATHRRFLLDYLARVRATYPHLVNYVDTRNQPSVRWLKRLGFEVHPPAPFGVAGLPFHKFEVGHV